MSVPQSVAFAAETNMNPLSMTPATWPLITIRAHPLTVRIPGGPPTAGFPAAAGTVMLEIISFWHVGETTCLFILLPFPTVTTVAVPTPPRSEEHTSELQSLAYLVCRLLLEKKKS